MADKSLLRPIGVESDTMKFRKPRYQDQEHCIYLVYRIASHMDSQHVCSVCLPAASRFFPFVRHTVVFLQYKRDPRGKEAIQAIVALVLASIVVGTQFVSIVSIWQQLRDREYIVWYILHRVFGSDKTQKRPIHKSISSDCFGRVLLSLASSSIAIRQLLSCPTSALAFPQAHKP